MPNVLKQKLLLKNLDIRCGDFFVEKTFHHFWGVHRVNGLGYAQFGSKKHIFDSNLHEFPSKAWYIFFTHLKNSDPDNSQALQTFY